MAGSVNKVIILGNLGRDPEVRSTQEGQKIVTFSVATSDRWKDRNSGEQRERTEWHRVVVFNENLANIAEQYLRKGSSVYLEGALQTRKWTDNQGVEKYTTEIVLSRYRGELTMLSPRNSDNASPAATSDNDMDQSQSQTAAGVSTGKTPPPLAKSDDLDDDIPF